MLLWFAVVAPILVAEIFRSPMVDHRTVALGAVLPLVEVVFDLPAVLHTLAGSVLALTLTMAVSINRRLFRRRLLGVPIGLFLHLVLDGTWTNARLFWWPGFGFGFGSERPPELGRSLAMLLVLEALAIGLGWWAWSRYELANHDNRQLLMKTGHLARGVLG